MAFRRDFERNGPSFYRICQTTLEGWKRYKFHPDARIRERFRLEVKQLKGGYSAALWAMERRLRKRNADVSGRVRALRKDVEREFGAVTKWISRVAGPFVLWLDRLEQRRLERGKVYEPPTIIERRNWVTTGVRVM